ncbi:MAG: general stress protein CsbD [Ignavibacteria bacterium]|nr:general stress protein CsbD [Ignavibacteria bacterium]
MGYPHIKGSWSEQKMKLKTKFASLTDSDLMYLEGKKVEMMMKLQLKLGKTHEELQEILAGL